jgi:hypothetical protein
MTDLLSGEMRLPFQYLDNTDALLRANAFLIGKIANIRIIIRGFQPFLRRFPFLKSLQRVKRPDELPGANQSIGNRGPPAESLVSSLSSASVKICLTFFA